MLPRPDHAHQGHPAAAENACHLLYCTEHDCRGVHEVYLNCIVATPVEDTLLEASCTQDL